MEGDEGRDGDNERVEALLIETVVVAVCSSSSNNSGGRGVCISS